MMVTIVSLNLQQDHAYIGNEKVSIIFSTIACIKHGNYHVSEERSKSHLLQPGSKLSVMSRDSLRIQMAAGRKPVHTRLSAFNPGVLLSISIQSPSEKDHNINRLRPLFESIFRMKNRCRQRCGILLEMYIVQYQYL